MSLTPKNRSAESFNEDEDQQVNISITPQSFDDAEYQDGVGKNLKLLYAMFCTDSESSAKSSKSLKTPVLNTDTIARRLTRNRKTFPQFADFPVEVQCMVFEQTLPAARILDFSFRVSRKCFFRGLADEIRNTTYISSAIRKYPGVLSLLETCQESNSAIYRSGFEKFEIFLPGAGQSSEVSTTIEKPDGTKHHFHFHTPENSLQYSYLRPNIDTLMVPVESFSDLYELGGSVGNLSCITHLALDGLDEIFVRNRARLTLFFRNLFPTIEKNCPTLKKLTFVVGFSMPHQYWTNKEGRKAPECRLIEIDDEFSSLAFVQDAQERTFFLTPDVDVRVDMCVSMAGTTQTQLKDYLVAQEESKETAAGDYWGKVNVIYAVKAYEDDDKGKRWWVAAASAVVDCDEDGAYLKKDETSV